MTDLNVSVHRPSPGTRAVSRARAAQGAWAATPLRSRAAVIVRTARALGSGGDRIEAALADALGCTAAEAWSAEIVPTIDSLLWLAGPGARALAPRRLGGSRLQWYFRATRHRLRHEPHGVVGVVSPSNAPLFLAVPQVAAALLAGNAVVWKPAPTGTLIAAEIASMLAAAGLPPDVLQLVAGGPEAARDLVHTGVDKLHFTGSAAAGLSLYRLHATRGRPAVLELSGGHVAIVLAPVDPGLAARAIVWGKRANGGRNCIAVQLVLVERGITGPFAAALRAAFEDAVGRGALRTRDADRARLARLVEDALARGAQLVTGAPGEPALLGGVGPGMAVVDTEVLGPLLAVAAVESAEAALAWVNGRPERLSASIWTADARRARSLAARLDVGQVWINEQLHPAAHPEATLAARGASGFGATRGLAGLMEMVQPKIVSETPGFVPRPYYAPDTAGLVEMLRASVQLGLARGLVARLRTTVALVWTLVRRGQ